MTASRTFIKSLAFFRRAIGRSLGMWRDYPPGESLQERSEAYLRQLNKPSEALDFRIALENLAREYDLFYEEAALLPGPRRLMIRLIQLAENNTTAREVAQERLLEAPVSKLFSAIISQGYREGAAALRIQFKEQAQSFPVYSTHNGDWKEMMTIPSALAEPLRGVLELVRDATYERVRPYLRWEHPLPEHVQLRYEQPSLVELVFG